MALGARKIEAPYLVEKFRSDDQRGVTLIELLVTILIVAVLSSAATSMFLHQRRKGWMAQVVSATKSLASVQEYWVNTVGAGGYTPNLDDLVDHGFNYSAEDVAPEIVAASSRSFCLEVTSRHDASIVWHYDSSVGRPDDGPINASCIDTVLVANAANAPAPSNNSTSSSSGTSEEGSTSRVDLSGGGSSTDGGSETTSSQSGSASGGAVDASTTSGDSSSGQDSGSGSEGSTNGSGDTSDQCDPADGTSNAGDGDGHPSGRDRSTENGRSGDQGGSESDPDGDANGGSDKPDGSGGADGSDQDGNNGSGNDSDFEDDNRGPDGSGRGSRTEGACTTGAPGDGAVVIPW